MFNGIMCVMQDKNQGYSCGIFIFESKKDWYVKCLGAAKAPCLNFLLSNKAIFGFIFIFH